MMTDYNNIDFLRKQFLCCTPLNKFKWPDTILNADIDTQKQIINATVNNELVLKYPIKQSYVKAFLKLFIDKLEKNGIEIDDSLYLTYCYKVALPNEQESLMHFRHFLLNSDRCEKFLSIKESVNIISQGTTGLCSWKAAYYLAEWCIANKKNIKGKTVLELGSGVGLTGLTVINFCSPKMYYFSDCHSIVLKTLKENIYLNLLSNNKKSSWEEILSNDRIEFENIDNDKSMNIRVLNLRWEDVEKLNIDQMDVDLVIAADVLYDNSTFKSLAFGLKQLLCKEASYAIVAATVRNEVTIEEFLSILDKYNLVYKEEMTSMPHIFIHTEDTPIRILKISRQSK